jgi:hypothetical protein
LWYACIHQYRVAAAGRDVCHALSWRLLTTTLCSLLGFARPFDRQGVEGFTTQENGDALL